MTPLTLRECPLCGSATWWRARRPGSPWICATCLPPMLEPGEVEWREEVLAALAPAEEIDEVRA